jgi:hypothetical protein
MRIIGRGLCIAFALMMHPVPAVVAQSGDKVDLALILAIDCSGSVDRGEFNLQLTGIAKAFRDPAVLAAIQAGPHGKIQVNAMLWADPDEEKLTTGWFEISNEQQANSFAATVEAFDIRIGGGTGLGTALGYGVALLQNTEFKPTRKTIDVSGDGKESWEMREPRFRLAQAQVLLRDSDVTVNGLAIANDVPDLKEYYRDYVISGPDRFVMSVASYEAFGEAMRIKLLREISTIQVSQR